MTQDVSMASDVTPVRLRYVVFTAIGWTLVAWLLWVVVVLASNVAASYLALGLWGDWVDTHALVLGWIYIVFWKSVEAFAVLAVTSWAHALNRSVVWLLFCEALLDVVSAAHVLRGGQAQTLWAFGYDFGAAGGWQYSSVTVASAAIIVATVLTFVWWRYRSVSLRLLFWPPPALRRVMSNKGIEQNAKR
ncbi:MAG: hypothetical protein HGA39_09230 [Coriobacteriia bacterium]|nr:hypothetical protein [Coriobacteriia bacterium]